jgi:hypothetical protein
MHQAVQWTRHPDDESTPKPKPEVVMPEIKAKKMTVVILVSSLVLSVLLAVIAWQVLKGHSELDQIKEAQTQEAHFLMATVDFATEQQRLTLFIRDVVFDEWKRVKYKGTYDKAFSIATAIVKESTKYPYMSVEQFALLMTSIQDQESLFQESTSNSTSGAKGIAQFMPSTGRMMARVIGVEYNDSLLYNAETAIRMQGVYLDILLSTYSGDVEAVVAEYNGGSWGPVYWKHDKSRLSQETLKYVPDVVSRYHGYLEEFKTYKVTLKAAGVSLK